MYCPSFLTYPFLMAACATSLAAASTLPGTTPELDAPAPAGSEVAAPAQPDYPADAVLYKDLHNGEEIALPQALHDAVDALNRELQPLVHPLDYLGLLKYELAAYLNAERRPRALETIKGRLQTIIRHLQEDPGNPDALPNLTPHIRRSPAGAHPNSSEQSPPLPGAVYYDDHLYSVRPTGTVSFYSEQLGADTLFIALSAPQGEYDFRGAIVGRLSDSSCYILLCPSDEADVQPFVALVDPAARDMQILGLMHSPEFFKYYSPDTGILAQRFGRGWREALAAGWSNFVTATELTFSEVIQDGWNCVAESTGLRLPCRVDDADPSFLPNRGAKYEESGTDVYERRILMPDVRYSFDFESNWANDYREAKELTEHDTQISLPARIIDEKGKRSSGFVLSTDQLELSPRRDEGKSEPSQPSSKTMDSTSPSPSTAGRGVTLVVDTSESRAGTPSGSAAYALLLPNGHYTGSPQCEDFLYVSDGKYHVDMEALAPWRNRPAEVLRALGGDEEVIKALEFTTKRWLEKIGFDANRPEPALDELPVVSFLHLPYMTDQPTVTAKVRLKATKHDISQVVVSVDDVPIELPASAISCLPVPAGSSAEIEFPLELERGRNMVRIHAVDAEGIRGDSVASLVLSSCPAQPQRAFIVALGVSDYDCEPLQLAYAAKDAADISRVLSQLGERDEVKTLLLRDKEVTRDVLSQVSRFLAETKPSDIVYFYLAGHGMLDEKLDYYYAPCDFDPEDVSGTGISMDDLLHTLSRTAARKRLLLVDTCHAGELDEEEEDKIAMANGESLPEGVRAVKSRGMKVKKVKSTISATTKKRYINEFFDIAPAVQGINVIAASAGAEYAQESGEWNNGVFTVSLIRAFVGLEHADNNRDGYLTVPELYQSVMQQVMKLTGGTQRPTATFTREAHYTPAAYSLYYGVPGECAYDSRVVFLGTSKVYAACNWPLLERKLELYRRYEQRLHPAYELLMVQSIYFGATRPIVEMVCRSGYNPDDRCFEILDEMYAGSGQFLTQRAKDSMKCIIEYTDFDADFYRKVLKACESQASGGRVEDPKAIKADTPDRMTLSVEAEGWLQDVKKRLKNKISSAQARKASSSSGEEQSADESDDDTAWDNPKNSMTDEMRLRQYVRTTLIKTIPGFIRCLSINLEAARQDDPAADTGMGKPYKLVLIYKCKSSDPDTPDAEETARYTAVLRLSRKEGSEGNESLEVIRQAEGEDPESVSGSGSGDPAQDTETQTPSSGRIEPDEDSAPLHSAAVNGYLESVEVPREAGANINPWNRSGHSPLPLASYRGHTEIGKALMAAGADIHDKNRNGATPLGTVATETRHKMLRQARAW